MEPFLFVIMGHRIIYIEKCEYLHLYLDNLKVVYNDEELLLPIADIQILVVDNYKASFTVQLLNKLTEKNVCTILCGVDHLPRSYILPMNGHFSQSGNIMKQIEWGLEIKKYLHKRIVQAKIHNQIEILKKYHKSEEVIEKLMKFENEVETDDRTNREGLAAKMYFRELFGKDFVRFNEDVINAGLNYGYSIFRALITSVIVAKGYLPNLGLFHIGKQNMFNLSDDLIEVFRPIVDDYVYENLINEIFLSQNHREELIQLTIKKIEIDGRKQTMNNAIYVYFESILKTLENGEDSYIFPLPFCYDL